LFDKLIEHECYHNTNITDEKSIERALIKNKNTQLNRRKYSKIFQPLILKMWIYYARMSTVGETVPIIAPLPS